MSEKRNLRDAYRQPGFVPRANLEEVYFDPEAFGVSLSRRRKKQSVAFAGDRIEASTIKNTAGCATWIAQIGMSIWDCRFAGYFAASVWP
jgi:hypothetical protein